MAIGVFHNRDRVGRLLCSDGRNKSGAVLLYINFYGHVMVSFVSKLGSKFIPVPGDVVLNCTSLILIHPSNPILVELSIK